MLKSLNGLGTAGSYLTIIKAVLDKLTAKFMQNEEKLKAFSLSSVTRQGYQFPSLVSNTVLNVLGN